jgi:hypothetical protein
MNEQALVLQRMVQKFRPQPESPSIQWLLHTCTVGLDLAAMTQACEILLGELGWETMTRMAQRLHEDGPNGRCPKAFVAQTSSAEIQIERLSGTPAIIFVLDTTPASLIKTYRQIKTLVWQRHEFGARIGLLFVSPIDGGRERLLASCQQFLGVRPAELGVIPSSLVRGAKPVCLTVAGSQLKTRDAPALAAWRPFVRRCLNQW